MLSYVGMAHPELKGLLNNSNCEVFIDGTFAICPTNYTQVLVLMFRDPPTDMYVPVYYLLLQRKLESVYTIAFEEIMSTLNKSANFSRVHCDFEKSLINAVKVCKQSITITR